MLMKKRVSFICEIISLTFTVRWVGRGIMISPSIVVTCAHVVGARPSDPKHPLYHFRLSRVFVNGLESQPLYVGEATPIHQDIAILKTPVPIVESEGLCFNIKNIQLDLYTVRPTKFRLIS